MKALNVPNEYCHSLLYDLLDNDNFMKIPETFKVLGAYKSS